MALRGALKRLLPSLAHVFVALAATAAPAAAQSPLLKPELKGIDFLRGHWSTPSHGKVQDTGGSSAGDVDFTVEAGGSVLLRKDHVRLYNAAGDHTGDFDILMTIYAERGAVRADYADGDHIIHYTTAKIDPGRSVSFETAVSNGEPTFKLTYTLTRPSTLDIAFKAAPPGTTNFQPVATGSAVKDR
jgi:hypothetical protein